MHSSSFVLRSLFGLTFGVICLLGLATPVSAGDTDAPTVSTYFTDSSYPIETSVALAVLVNDVGGGTVDRCRLLINDSVAADNLPYTNEYVNEWEYLGLPGGTFIGRRYSKSYKFLTEGHYSVVFECFDNSGNSGRSEARHITITPPPDTAGPAVTASAPSSVRTDQSATFIGEFTDASRVVSCRFLFDGTPFITMPANASEGNVSVTRSEIPVGTHTFAFDCQDEAGNVGVSATQTITVTAAPSTPTDSTPPTIGPISPSSVVAGVATTMNLPYTDNIGVTSCQFLPSSGGGGVMQLGAPASGAATRSHTFSTPGTVTVNIICGDAAGNTRVDTQTVSVSAAPVADTTAPALSSLLPGSATRGNATTLSVSYSDAVGVTACSAEVDGVFVGAATLNGITSGTATRAHTFTSAGTHAVKFTCRDAAGNTRESSVLSVSVTEPTSTPASFPSVGFIGTTAAQVNATITLSATVSDSGSGLARCELVINGVTQGNMTVNGSIASRNHTFANIGSYTAYVRCWNNAGNTTNGPSVAINVSSVSSNPTPAPTPTTPTTPSTPSGNPGVGTLIKLACPNYVVAADHPCKAVYYYGNDNRRHAFPNSQVYFTWYNDFSAVREVSPSFMASIPLGRNITYRPGVRMVKFTTLNRVYAVSRGSVLRWVTTEQAAQVLYGPNWARQIDDIADLFFTDYSFGNDISSVNDFNPGTAMQQATTIDQNW